MQLIKPLIITTIGEVGVGKTVGLCLIAEILFDEFGFNNFVTYSFERDKEPIEEFVHPSIVPVFMQENHIGIIKIKEPVFILVDNLETKIEFQRVSKLNSISVRIHKQLPVNGHHVGWLYDLPTDIFLTNSGNDFRLFKFQLKDLILNEFTKTKAWKESVIE